MIEKALSRALSVHADVLLDLLDATLQAQDLLLQRCLLTLQGGDLLLEPRVLVLLLREVLLYLLLHALHVADHCLLHLLQLSLVVLLDVRLVAAKALDLLALRGQLLVLHRDEVLKGRELALEARWHGVRHLDDEEHAGSAAALSRGSAQKQEGTLPGAARVL